MLIQFRDWIIDFVPFSLYRFNDGELECVQGRSGENCDGQKYSEDLGILLRGSLDYIMAKDNVFIPNPVQGIGENITPRSSSDWDFINDMRIFLNPYIERHNFTNWVNHFGIHHRAGHLISDLKNLILTIKRSKQWKVYVGPNRMNGLCDFLNCDISVDVPEVNAFSEYDRIRQNCFNVSNGHTVFIITAGIMAKPLMADIINTHPLSTCLDFGSSFDPMFVGQTRTGQPTMEEMKEFYNL